MTGTVAYLWLTCIRAVGDKAAYSYPHRGLGRSESATERLTCSREDWGGVMASQNFDYYRLRADEELAAAKHAADPSIAQIHREMERRYREMLSPDTDAAYGDLSLAKPMGGAIVESGPIPA